MPGPTKGSLKLAHILDAYPQALVRGAVCADLGCNVGGFTRELLRRGAAKVVAVDCGFGALAYDLRKDPRVEVRERRNALFQEDFALSMDLVVSDLAWTPQSRVVPKALGYLKPGAFFFSLVKPQYELSSAAKAGRKPILSDEDAEAAARAVYAAIAPPPRRRVELRDSPIRGGRGKKGNLEFWLVFWPESD